MWQAVWALPACKGTLRKSYPLSEVASLESFSVLLCNLLHELMALVAA